MTSKTPTPVIHRSFVPLRLSEAALGSSLASPKATRRIKTKLTARKVINANSREPSCLSIRTVRCASAINGTASVPSPRPPSASTRSCSA